MLPALLVLALAGDPAHVKWRAPAALFERAPQKEPWTPPLTWAGRIVTTSTFHLGVRSHFLATPDEIATAVTLQVTLAISP